MNHQEVRHLNIILRVMQDEHISVPANQFQGDQQEPTLELSFQSLEDPRAMSIYKITTQLLIKH